MAKEKGNDQTISNLDWDSPPNNRFTPWPIELKCPKHGNEGNQKKESRGGDTSQEDK